MKKIFLIRLMVVSCISILVFLVIHNVNASDVGGGAYKADIQWQTKKELRVPESVLYDESRNILYVSNINGKSTEKNGQGFISKVTLDGRIEVLKWVTGLHAPKGSAIYKNKLYVSDIDHLIEIDVSTGKILAKYPTIGAKFLNDVATDSMGNVYVTDMSSENSVIYILRHDTMSVWMKGGEISRPNGLDVEGNSLLVGNSGDGSLKAINLADKTITTIARVGSGIDGLRSDGKGNYFISDWRGKTLRLAAAGQRHRRRIPLIG